MTDVSAPLLHLPISIRSYDYRPLCLARVAVSVADRDVATLVTDARGFCSVDVPATGDITLRVEAAGLVSEVRTFRPGTQGQMELFLLGKPGMAWYLQGRVRVPVARSAESSRLGQWAKDLLLHGELVGVAS